MFNGGVAAIGRLMSRKKEKSSGSAGGVLVPLVLGYLFWDWIKLILYAAAVLGVLYMAGRVAFCLAVPAMESLIRWWECRSSRPSSRYLEVPTTAQPNFESPSSTETYLIALQVNQGIEYRKRVEGSLLKMDRLLIDTNIWMNARYHSNLSLIADAAHQDRRTLTILGPELEELVRLKRSRLPAKAADAKAALRLIEKLQIQGQLRIEHVSINHVPRAYFDAVAQKLVLQELALQRTVAIVTDDAELRVRLRGRVNGCDSGRFRVFSGPDLDLHECRLPTFISGFLQEPDARPTTTESVEPALT